MNSNYSKALSKEEKDEFKGAFLEALRFRKATDKVIERKKEEIVKKMCLENNFEAGAWSEKQAYLLGQIEALDLVKGWLSQKI